MSKDSSGPKPTPTSKLETVEPIGARVLVRKDEDKKQTKAGIHLPDKIEIPTITGRVVAISAPILPSTRALSCSSRVLKPCIGPSRSEPEAIVTPQRCAISNASKAPASP